MLRSIILTSLRNIFRNRTFSIINLLGLSVGMSLGLLIITIVIEQFTFDDFHQHADRIYRVNTMALRTDGGREPYASTPLPIAEALQEGQAFTEEVVRINVQFRSDAVYQDVNVPLRGFFTDPSFLRVFNFPLLKGNPATALNEPNSMVLTMEAAEKVFGKADPLGKTLSLGKFGEFTVTGVLQKFPSKTHLDFEMLGSTSALPLLEKEGKISPSLDDWNNYYSGYVYFRLKPDRTPQEVETALQAISKEKYANLTLEARDRGYEFYLHALNEITPGPELSNQMGNGMPDIVIIFLGVLTFVVMLMACFNYTNLMVAKSLSRAREIGVRKVVGARRWQVFLQFIGEAVVFSLLALAFSYVIFQFLKPAFMELNIAREFSADLKEDFSIYGWFVLFAIAVGLLAGLVPAGYLSAFRPTAVLKDSGNLKVYSRLTFRKVLVVTQFALSLMFILFVLVVFNQVNFMISKDYGFRDDNILNVRLQGMEFQKLANEVRSIAGVQQVGGVSHALGTWADRSSEYKRDRGDKPFTMRDFVVDDNYVSNLEFRFIAGSNFKPEEEGSEERHVILNEQALKLFGFNDAFAAMNQLIYTDDSVALRVIGVVKDFHFRPLKYQIGPIALRYKFSELGYLSAAIDPGRKDQIVSDITAVWKRLDPVHPIRLKMMKDEIDDAYSESGFVDVVKIVGYISFLAICLACMGMLGMAMYSTQTRIKEIGVRKIMGASVQHITFLLSRSFLILIGIAALLGTPVGYYLGDLFLQTYAYRIEITPWLILSGFFLVAILGVITIGSQTWKAASADPVKALRYE